VRRERELMSSATQFMIHLQLSSAVVLDSIILGDIDCDLTAYLFLPELWKGYLQQRSNLKAEKRYVFTPSPAINTVIDYNFSCLRKKSCYLNY
jgi:hypothetical protein